MTLPETILLAWGLTGLVGFIWLLIDLNRQQLIEREKTLNEAEEIVENPVSNSAVDRITVSVPMPFFPKGKKEHTVCFRFLSPGEKK